MGQTENALVRFDGVGLTLAQEMTTPSRPGKRPRPVWVVSGRTEGLEQSLLDLGGRKYRGAYSFFADPTEALKALTEEDRLGFAQRQERDRERAADRADRYDGYAENAAGRSEAAHARVESIASMIPFGQPILVGHHSERRHRRDADRIHTGMGKAVEEARKSEHWEGRAATARRQAEGKHDAAFCDRRLKEAQALLRNVERKIAGGASGEWLARLTGLKAEYGDRIAYWTQERETAGGIVWSKANVGVGDLVLIRGRWREVARVNPATVGVKTDYSWTDKYPYSEIRHHRSKGETETAA